MAATAVALAVHTARIGIRIPVVREEGAMVVDPCGRCFMIQDCSDRQNGDPWRVGRCTRPVALKSTESQTGGDSIGTSSVGSTVSEDSESTEGGIHVE